jgi:hypothetical protein
MVPAIKTVWDRMLWWVSGFIPQCVCVWLYNANIPLGKLAPHVLGRMLGVEPVRVSVEEVP